MGGYTYAANNPATDADPTGLCGSDNGVSWCAGGGSGPAQSPGGNPGSPALNPPPPTGYTNLGPGVKVQNNDPKAAALSQAYYNYLNSEGANPDQIGLSQSYGIWTLICQANPGLCPGSMYMGLTRAGSGIVAAGGIFVVSSAFGGAIPVPAGLSAVEEAAYIRAYQIYNSSELNTLRSAVTSGESAEVRVAGLSVIYEPGMPASGGYAGMSLHDPDGFALGPRAFESETDLSQTILWESYRLAANQSANGLTGESATAYTEDTAAFVADSAQMLLGEGGIGGAGDGDAGGGGE